jgi:hypothetical protein
MTSPSTEWACYHLGRSKTGEDVFFSFSSDKRVKILTTRKQKGNKGAKKRPPITSKPWVFKEKNLLSLFYKSFPNQRSFLDKIKEAFKSSSSTTANRLFKEADVILNKLPLDALLLPEIIDFYFIKGLKYERSLILALGVDGSFFLGRAWIIKEWASKVTGSPLISGKKITAFEESHLEGKANIFKHFFPKTLRLMQLACDLENQAEAERLVAAAHETMSLESAARFGFAMHKFDDLQTVLRIASLSKSSRLINSKFLIDCELVCGWIDKGYSLMDSKHLSKAVSSATGIPINSTALQKRRERLGLETKRNPGTLRKDLATKLHQDLS